MNDVKIGYVGLNHHHCEPYLQSIAQLPVSLTCAFEPDGSFDVDSVDGLGDIPVYGSLETLLEREGDDLDLIWITLSNRDAPDVIEQVIEYGLDVYTEKPIARTAAELDPVIERASEADVTVGVSYTWRGHPIARDLRERTNAGFYGTVRTINAQFMASKLAYRDTDHYLFDRDASRGGIVQWLGIHWIDLVPWILDDPIARVNAQMNSSVAEVDVEDGATLQFETESGAFGTLQCGYYLREDQYDTQVNIYGSDGRSRWDPIGETFGFDGETSLEVTSVDNSFSSAPKRNITYEYDPIPGYGGAPGLEFMQEYLEARTTPDASVPADLEDARRVLRVLDAVYESAETNEWTTVES